MTDKVLVLHFTWPIFNLKPNQPNQGGGNVSTSIFWAANKKPGTSDQLSTQKCGPSGCKKVCFLRFENSGYSQLRKGKQLCGDPKQNLYSVQPKRPFQLGLKGSGFTLPSVSLARPPVGWQSTMEQETHSTTV